MSLGVDGALPPVRMTLLLPQSHVLEVVPGDGFLAHEVTRAARERCGVEVV